MADQQLRNLLARHDQFLRRVKRMLSAGERHDPLPEDAKFHEGEIKSLDGETCDALIDLRGSLPTDNEWLPPGRYAFVHGYMKPGELTWLRAFEQGLLRSKNYLEIYRNTTATEVFMGDKVVVGAAQVVMTGGSTAGDITTHGSAQHLRVDVASPLELAEELGTLRRALRAHSDPDDPQHDIELGAVAQAEKCARSGDRNGALEKLKSAGQWCLDVATKIGVALATEAIKQSTGLGHR